MNKKLLVLAFAISGFTALVYEVVWSRSLQLVFGSTVYAVSTILTTFLAGFAIGSYLFGNISEKSKSPEIIFSIIQVILGIYGLATLVLFKIAEPVYLALNVPILEFGFLFLLLIIPATLFGASWPLINKAYSRREKIGKDTGVLYSFNSFGSFLGSMSAGFLLIPLLGISKTLVLTACLNLVVGILILIKTAEVKNGH